VLDAIRRRRVTRSFTAEPVSADVLREILRAARCASSAGNRRIHRFLVIRDAATVKRLKPFAPGMLGWPPALIVVSTDLEQARKANVQFERDMNSWIDVGTALMSMMLAAQALGLGSCPATSFSQAAVARLLDFPPTLLPELILQLGHPLGQPSRSPRRASALRLEDLTDWERLGQREPEPDATASSTRAEASESTIQSTR